MMGFSATVFINNGKREHKGEARQEAPKTADEWSTTMAWLTAAIRRRLQYVVFTTEVEVGIYVEMFPVHPTLEAYFVMASHASRAKGHLEMEWTERPLVKLHDEGGLTNGQK